jgi:serine/threonine-protein kinase HipA
MSAGTITVHMDYYGRPFLVGRLHVHSRAGRRFASFLYDREWLDNRIGFALQPSLQFTPGRFYTNPGQEMFACFSDCSPDRWGRVIMQRRESKRAQAEKRTARRLLESDYLLQVNDQTRQGALRFTLPDSPAFLTSDGSGIPSVHGLCALLSAADNVSAGTDTAEDLRMLFQPGSSLGGARPKAAVRGVKGELLIAKFPSAGDAWDVPLWEYVSFRLAGKAGIDTPKVALENVDNRRILLAERFDRLPGGGRIPFASAMTLLGAEDGDHACYPDIFEIITADGAAPAKDAAELFRRMVFNILTSNYDDHLRNHGFLRTDNGWRLAPVYDLESSPDKAPQHHTFITPTDGASSLDLALEAAEFFRLSGKEARAIIKSVGNAAGSWRGEGKAAGASAGEIEKMAAAYERAELGKALRF